MGCTLSHIKAIYTAFKNNDELAIICEDDVSFSLLPFWPVSLNDIVKDFPSDWKVISLYFPFASCKISGLFVTLLISSCTDLSFIILNTLLFVAIKL
jgi:hypothetical protein